MNNIEDECDMCFEYQRCTGEKCTEHTLYDGHILDFARAMRDGKLWGDIIYEEEQKILAKETNAEKQKRLKMQSGNDRKAMDGLRNAILNKNHIKNCVKKDGKWVLKHKFPTKCENLKLPETVFPDGSTYPGGCWAHIDKVCPYMHPDEKDKYDFKGKKKIDLINSNTRKWKGGRKRKANTKKNH
jgi:hypothetical protein